MDGTEDTHHLFSDDYWDMVQSAAVRVAEGLPSTLRVGLDEKKVLDQLDFLVEALSGRAEATRLEAAGQAEIASFTRLLELLYSEVIRAWSQHPPSKFEMLRFLRLSQSVYEEISRHRDQVDFPVMDANGTDLVVELAHDLRSPLTSIIFLTESLRRGQSGEINELQRRQLGIIYSAALGLVSVASDVIELTRAGSRLLERQPSRFSIAELLDSISDMLTPIADEKSLPLRISGPERDSRTGHAVALSRVLLNLASNALRFTAQGYVEISARETSPTRIEFSVRDTGPGLAVDEVSKLFEPLRRNPRNNRFGFSGSGLGLAISRRLVSSMGGQLQYETAPDWGTRFYFEVDLPPASLA